MEQLTLHKSLEVFLNFINDEMWAMTCLDSIALCLSHPLFWDFYNPTSVRTFGLTSHFGSKDLGSNLSSMSKVKK
jgi:hypothetical protein